MKRIYTQIIKEHIADHKQMIFLVGPRQVGKTTVSLMAQEFSHELAYLNWDNLDHRKIILEGPSAIAQFIGIHKISKNLPVVVFDEIHKFGKWKQFLKGFYDTYKDQVKIIVTGSAKLDIYKRGGDSLMGRYFPYRVHPLSLAELMNTAIRKKEIQKPSVPSKDSFKKLLKFGGFPEPYLKNNTRFSNRWQSLRQDQLIKEDIRDLTRIQELGQMEVLIEHLKWQAGGLVNYSTLASKSHMTVRTITKWLETLYSTYFCFPIRPWTVNVPRSLVKEPKIYLWDWALIKDEGARFENLVACHLLKAVHFWQDFGFGEYKLWFLRDKEKREVDFLVTKNNQPWFLVESKLSESKALNKNLFYFQEKLGMEYAFQVVADMQYVDKDCFEYKKPVIVPVETFLSQLV
ncbi:MAG: ATP-binding protein [Candidatus Omnitrophica bacterium]|nr:ATP-binding protein [Candidatus Omnitrophota bacterium]